MNYSEDSDDPVPDEFESLPQMKMSFIAAYGEVPVGAVGIVGGTLYKKTQNGWIIINDQKVEYVSGDGW